MRQAKENERFSGMNLYPEMPRKDQDLEGGMGYLISETTREEREQIVKDSLGNIDASCDGCMAGLAEMYQDYIEGRKELREINMEFRAGYVKNDEMPEKSGCGYAQ